jgi:hypothetical protein
MDSDSLAQLLGAFAEVESFTDGEHDSLAITLHIQLLKQRQQHIVPAVTMSIDQARRLAVMLKTAVDQADAALSFQATH